MEFDREMKKKTVKSAQSKRDLYVLPQQVTQDKKIEESTNQIIEYLEKEDGRNNQHYIA